jgi:hypothetical protein
VTTSSIFSLLLGLLLWCCQSSSTTTLNTPCSKAGRTSAATANNQPQLIVQSSQLRSILTSIPRTAAALSPTPAHHLSPQQAVPLRNRHDVHPSPSLNPTRPSPPHLHHPLHHQQTLHIPRLAPLPALADRPPTPRPHPSRIILPHRCRLRLGCHAAGAPPRWLPRVVRHHSRFRESGTCQCREAGVERGYVGGRTRTSIRVLR